MMTPDEGILIVDDEHLIVIGLELVLKQLGYLVCGTAATGPKAIDLALRVRPKLVLMDVRLKGKMDGVETARAIRDQHPCHIIFITGSNEPETRRRVEEAAPDGFLVKPILSHHLQAAIQSLTA
jgi:DNA-binding NarL/FixJ family response regulator